MMRTVTQTGDSSRPMITVEFDEKQICHLEHSQPIAHMDEPADPGAATLRVYLQGRAEPILVDEPLVVAKLWKPSKPPKKEKK